MGEKPQRVDGVERPSAGALRALAEHHKTGHKSPLKCSQSKIAETERFLQQRSHLPGGTHRFGAYFIPLPRHCQPGWSQLGKAVAWVVAT